MIRAIIVLCLGTFTTPISFRETIYASNHVRLDGGRPVLNQGSPPFFAQVVYMNRFHCGGTIISDRAILTAASCLMFDTLYNYKVYVGNQSIYQGDVYHVLDIIKHPEFSMATYEHNIGLIHTTEPILYRESDVETLPLYSGSIPLEGLKYVVVMGFGYSKEDTTYTQTINTGLAQVVSNEQCNNSYHNEPLAMAKIDENIFCTGGKTGPCKGDEGGPAVYMDQLIGVVSWGLDCGEPKYPRTYVYVPNYKEWILDNIVPIEMPPYKDNGNTGTIKYTMVYIAEGKEIMCVAVIITVRDFLTSTYCSTEIEATTWSIYHGHYYPIIKVYPGFSIYPEETNKQYDIIFLQTNPIQLLEPYYPVIYVSSYANITKFRKDASLLTFEYIQSIGEHYVEVYTRMIEIIYKDRCQFKYGEVIPFKMDYLNFCIKLVEEDDHFGTLNASPVFSALTELLGMIVWQGTYKGEAFAVALYTPRFFAYWEKFIFNGTSDCRNGKC